MFRPESNKTIVRARIAHVRETLDDHRYLSMNPFMEGRSEKNLCAVFGVFADDTKAAAKALSVQADVEMFNVREADTKGYMFGRGVYLAGKNGKMPELLLCGAFQDRVYKAFTTLRSMEQFELATGGYDITVARDAMKALASTYIMARAVPVAFGYKRYAPSPVSITA